MKKVYTFVGALLVSSISFAQIQQQEKLSVPEFKTSVDKPQQKSLAQTDIIWEEDFDNGLD